MGIPEPIQVSCYAGARGGETPRAFKSSTAGQLGVVQVLERWVREVSRRVQKEYFRILASDGRIYILYRDRSLDLWFLESKSF
jgi:hypothetical protein